MENRSGTVEAGRVHDLDALTGVRFFAAFAVFCAHYLLLEVWLPNTPLLVLQLRNSFPLAVYVFFILSGFILTIAYQKMESGPRNLRKRKEFWIARFARMYPVYLFSLIWFAPFLLRHRFAVEPAGLALKKSLSAWTAAFFLVQSWISDRFGQSWNGPTWTLSVEAGFYVAFPWLLRGILRLGTRGLIVTGIVLASWGGWMLTGPAIFGTHVRSPLTLMPVFALGIVTACLYQKWHSLASVQHVAKLLPVPSLIVMATFAVPWLETNVALNFGCIIFLIAITAFIFGLASRGWPANLLSTPAMMLLGEASYSFYLLQFPVHATVTWIWLRWTRADILALDRLALPEHHFAGFIILLVINQTIALAAFVWIERPLRILLREKLGRYFVKQELPPPVV